MTPWLPILSPTPVPSRTFGRASHAMALATIKSLSLSMMLNGEKKFMFAKALGKSAELNAQDDDLVQHMALALLLTKQANLHCI